MEYIYVLVQHNRCDKYIKFYVMVNPFNKIKGMILHSDSKTGCVSPWINIKKYKINV